MKKFLRMVWFGVASGCTIFTVVGVVLALALGGATLSRGWRMGLSEWRSHRW